MNQGILWEREGRGSEKCTLGGLWIACHQSLVCAQVHVNLLLLEARMQAALLYALRAITRYMT
jgi:hypothetical protein